MGNSPYFPGCNQMRADHFEHMGDNSKTVENYPQFKAVGSEQAASQDFVTEGTEQEEQDKTD